MNKNLETVLPEIKAIQGLSDGPAVDRSEAEGTIQELREVVEKEMEKRYKGVYLSKDKLEEVSAALTKAIRKKFRGASVMLTKSRSGEIYLETEMPEGKEPA